MTDASTIEKQKTIERLEEFTQRILFTSEQEEAERQQRRFYPEEKQDKVFPGTLANPCLLSGKCNYELNAYYDLQRLIDEARSHLKEVGGDDQQMLTMICALHEVICHTGQKIFEKSNPYNATTVSDFAMLQYGFFHSKSKFKQDSRAPARRYYAVFALAKFAQFSVAYNTHQLMNLIPYGNASGENPRWYSIANPYAEKPTYTSSFDMLMGLSDLAEFTKTDPMLNTPTGFYFMSPLLEGIEALREIEILKNQTAEKQKKNSEEKLGQEKEQLEADLRRRKRLLSEAGKTGAKNKYNSQWGEPRALAKARYAGWRPNHPSKPAAIIARIIVKELVSSGSKAPTEKKMCEWLREFERENPALKKVSLARQKGI